MTVDPGRATTWLRLEGLMAGLLSVGAYTLLSLGGWIFFVLLFLLPDVSMAGYLANTRVGAYMYNAAHTYVAPAILTMIGWFAEAPIMYSIALVWTSHIGFDRSLGYGLKFPTTFHETHLGRIGRGVAR